MKMLNMSLKEMMNIDKAQNKIQKQIKLSDQRLEICRACDYVFKPTMQCKKCGCFLHAKTMLSNQRCDIGKW